MKSSKRDDWKSSYRTVRVRNRAQAASIPDTHAREDWRSKELKGGTDGKVKSL